jgi:cyclic beta-1,2-glucan synthetase
MAGDVCTQPPYTGRGGWSWYTGSAAWMARAATETVCGLQVRGSQVCLRPHLPSHWPSVTLWLQRGAQRHAFTVCAAWASSDIASAQAAGAQRLALGEWCTVDANTPARHHLLVLG